MSHRILFAMTSHGLGHVMRSLAVARQLKAVHPDVDLVVATTTPRPHLQRQLGIPFSHRAVAYEPGTVQRNCFELDITATGLAYKAFFRERQIRLDAEIEFLRTSGCTAVVSDIAALPIRAASHLGLPAVGVSNFTWDWILEPLFSGSDLEPGLKQLADDYACGTHHLRLPFGPDISPFRWSEPAPLVSRRATLAPREVRQRLGIPFPDPLALVTVCPGGWDADAWQPIGVRDCHGIRFVTVGDLPVTADVPLHRFSHELPGDVGFPDLVNASDLVISKPAYGIASECALHQTPMVMIQRTCFRETPVLVEAFGQLGPLAELTLDDFFAGRWEDALTCARGSQTVWKAVATDGVERVASRLAQILAITPS